MDEKLTKEKIESMIEEEKKSAKEYYKYGLIDLAKDEINHAKFLMSLKGLWRAKLTEAFL